jgi:DNA transposition AAA+ family ATPase
MTSNTKAFVAALAALRDRGAGEACLMVVDGEPGLSKTRTAEWWAVQNGAVLLRAKREWTPSWMLRDLLARVTTEPPAQSFERMYRQALEHLARLAKQAERDGLTLAVLIDEADHIIGNGRAMETLRDLSDSLEIPFVFVGMGKISHQLKRYPQIASRVGQRVEFQRLSRQDAEALVKGLCEADVAADLVDFLHAETKGRAREIKEALAPIERMGRRNPGKPVDLAALAGAVLFNDRETGKPVKVPGAAR